MHKTRSSFQWDSKTKPPASRSGSSCSTITSGTSSGYGSSSSTSTSTSNISVIKGSSGRNSSSITSKQTEKSPLKSIKFATESAIFNSETESFQFETLGKLSARNIPADVQKDFHCWFGPSGTVTEKCAKCQISIKEKFLRVGGAVYHPKCFQCAKCGVTLGSGTHYGDNDNFYCKKDYMNLFSEKCSKCENPLAEEYVHVGEKLFHFKCFTCNVCHQKLDGYIEKDGIFYCEKHYQELFAKCVKCRKPCKDKFCRTKDGKAFHYECFLCQSCGRKLKTYFGSGGKYYCNTICEKKV